MENIYLPQICQIKEIKPETPDVKTFTLLLFDPKAREKFVFRPGQFVQVSVWGVGEAPFSIAGSQLPGEFQITVRTMGLVTRVLNRMRVEDTLGIRGPYGNGFPLERMKGHHLLFVGGGIGLPPLRSLIEYALERRNEFGRLMVLYGARTPGDLVYKELLQEWSGRNDLTLMVTVDVGDESWKGKVGLVTSLFEEIERENLLKDTLAFVCGPPLMIKVVISRLLGLGFSPDRIFCTLERQMRCGAGKCGHCCIGHKYVCRDGPVFSYQEMGWMREEI